VGTKIAFVNLAADAKHAEIKMLETIEQARKKPKREVLKSYLVTLEEIKGETNYIGDLKKDLRIDLLGDKQFSEITINETFPHKIKSPCNVLFSFGDDPTPEVAKTFSSLGHGRGKFLIQGAIVEQFKTKTVFTCISQHYGFSKQAPER